ncbi:MAG: ATP--guanido phosphotransferase [Oscillospiraceae bacterium]|nr:ATP--guanido phosphotransferase [Oscillospiraceae bacterium]
MNNIAVSTRVRFARNLKRYPFVGCMNLSQREELISLVKTALEKAAPGVFEYYPMNELSDIKAAMLVEEKLISHELDKDSGFVAISHDRTSSIMLGEEDHLRICNILPGLALGETLSSADKIDDILDQRLDYAFDENLGFLTNCPTNLGTGMRASVILHLPALEKAEFIPVITGSIGKLGLTVRGSYGEGTKVSGALYSISNQVTLGISEIESVSKLDTVVNQIMEREESARERMRKNDRYEDEIFRNYGIMRYARVMPLDEFMELSSWLRLGAPIMGISERDIDRLTVMASPAHLCGDTILSPEEINKKRADVVREFLGKGKI